MLRGGEGGGAAAGWNFWAIKTIDNGPTKILKASHHLFVGYHVHS